jgi:hypothetical protein
VPVDAVAIGYSIGMDLRVNKRIKLGEENE